LTGAGRALVVLAALFVIGAAVASISLSMIARGQADRAEALVSRGTVATGVVTRLWREGDNRRQVAYRFTVDGHAFDGRARVSDARRRELTTGAALAVRYLPENPRINDLGGTPRASFPVVLPYIVGFGLAALGALCLVAIHRERTLLEDGRATVGHVTGHSSHKSSHGGTQHAMTYEFTLLSGASATGKRGTSRRPPAIGSTLVVVYDREHPKRNQPYPFKLVTPAVD
jgi:hypothetical protein